jgi:signal transduction histidine kinase
VEAALSIVEVLVQALFVALGLACLRLWLRERSKAAAWSAVTFGVLAAVLVVSRISEVVSGEDPALWVTKLLVCGLVLFPFFLYRFMTAFWPSGPLLERFAFLFTAVLIVWTLALSDFPDEGEPRTVAFEVFILAFLVHWTTFSLIAAYRLWRAGRGQPTVARRRMRLLSTGAIGMALALILAGLQLGGDSVQLAVNLLSIASALLFFVGIAPPAFVRVTWRRPEQEQMRVAVIGLMRADTEEEIAENLLPHVAQVVGAPRAVLEHSDGTPIGSWGDADNGPTQPVRLEFGFGRLIVWTGAVTPFFGPEELDLLRSTGALIELAFERAELLARERQTVRRLEELDDLKNTFLSAVSHELRTPLAVIMGSAMTLAERGDRLAEEEFRELLATLVDSSRKLDALLTDLLDLDRLTRGVLELRRQPTDIGDLVRRVLDTLPLDGRTTNVETESVVVAVDAAKVERIAENLIANAARHTPVETPVWVRVVRVEDGCCLIVEDAGPGIPAELRESIFEPFRRGAQSAYVPGTGIGLSLVERFAALHGGRAWVEEREGGGASFRVFLPAGGVELEYPPAAGAAPAEATISVGRGAPETTNSG